MSLSKYEIFKTIVEVGSLTKAAEKLNMTQSGVSYAMSSLETEMGFPLLKRDRTGIRLTTNGQRIIKHIERIMLEEEKLRQEIIAINSIVSGVVKIGTLSSVSMQWLPGIFSLFNKHYPHIECKTYLGCYDEMNEWILDGTVDFGFLSLPTSKPFEVLPLAKDKLFVLLPPDHPLRDKTALTFEEIKNERFIMPQWGSDDNIRQLLHQQDLRLQIKYEIMEERTIFAMVQMGLGISILPEMILVNVPENIRVIDLNPPDHRIIGVATISFKMIPPAAKKFISCMNAWLKEANHLDFDSHTS